MSEEKKETKQEEKSLDEARDKKEPANAEAKAGKEKKSSGKFNEIIEKIEKLSVLELADLVKELEDKFGVSAAAPVAMASTPGAAGAAAPAEEEKANYTLMLADAGTQKIAVIKAVRVIRPELGLKEAKDLVDAAPKEVKKDMPKEDAEKAKKALEDAGAKVELK